MNVTLFSAFDASLNPYILLYKKSLEKQGVTVDIKREINLLWLFRNWDNQIFIHLHWLKTSYKPKKKWKNTKYLNKLIRMRSVKAFLDFYCLSKFILLLMLAKLSGKKIIITIHDLHYLDKKSIRMKLQYEVSRKITLRIADAVHVHNIYTKNVIRERYNRKNRVVVIPHGNYIGYYKNRISRTEARGMLKFLNEYRVYLFMGLLRPYKGIEELFHAFKNLNNCNARLVVAGSIFEGGNYKEKIRKLSQSDNRIILIPEFIPDDKVQIYFNACDFFVLPYKNITTSGAAFLALSFGKPIIAPNIASFPEVVTDDTGLLYKSDEKEGLSKAMVEAGSKEWSEKAIINYACQFSWTNIGQSLYELYMDSN